MEERYIIKRKKSCKDIWNASMLEGATFTEYDIPFCPTTAKKIPKNIITWKKAKAIYKKSSLEDGFFYDAFVCFYIDDYLFDGPGGIWHNTKELLRILKHFDGMITPDYSTYQDFPEAIKIYNTYRMRAVGYWLGKNGIAVINNVRWGTKETWKYCWSGIPSHSMVAIGTVGGSPRKLIDRVRFEEGIEELVSVLKPEVIIVYGSANYECFQKLLERGIEIISYTGETAEAFQRRTII